MDPISSTIRIAPDNFISHSKTVWENVLASMADVLKQAEITHIQPLGNIGDAGLNFDTYA